VNIKLNLNCYSAYAVAERSGTGRTDTSGRSDQSPRKHLTAANHHHHPNSVSVGHKTMALIREKLLALPCIHPGTSKSAASAIMTLAWLEFYMEVWLVPITCHGWTLRTFYSKWLY